MLPTAAIPYALSMLAAIVLCGYMLRRTQRGLQLSSEQKLGISLGAFIGAMIGAKLPFVLSDWSALLRGTAWFSHGKTIMSGIVGGYFGVELAKWILHVRIKTGDTFAAPVALAVAIGRLACFQAGCCYGTCTDLAWGVVFPTAANNPDCARHPTQLYEFLFHATAACTLYSLGKRRLCQGQLIKLYLLAYFAYRFGSEFIRPEPKMWYGLTAYQWAAAILFVLFSFLWWRDRKLFATRKNSADEITSL